MKTNGLFSINFKDIAKGLIMAVITALMTGVYTSIQSGTFPPDAAGLKTMGLSALAAAIAYLLKNFMTNSNDEFMKKDAPTS